MWCNSIFNLPIGACGGILNLLLIAFLIVAAAWLLLHALKRPKTTPLGRYDRDDSLEILKRKFVNQEISAEEYQRMKEILKD